MNAEAAEIIARAEATVAEVIDRETLIAKLANHNKVGERVSVLAGFPASFVRVATTEELELLVARVGALG